MFINNGQKYSFVGRKIFDMLNSTIDINLDDILQKTLEGKPLSKEHAYEIINSEATDFIADVAGKIRNRIKGRSITYSRKVFINLVNLCRDTCSYCTYKREPSDRFASMMTPQQVVTIAEAGRRHQCTEALFVTGERPEHKYPQVREWLRSVGHPSTVEYIREMSEMVLHKTGLLPHTNAGSLTKKEMSTLRDTNISLGVMLESASERLMAKGMPHEMAPSKNPKVRLRTLQNAWRIKNSYDNRIISWNRRKLRRANRFSIYD